MNEVIYVIVRKDDGTLVHGRGPRKILAYTTEGRAKAAMKPNRLSSKEYEVVEFTRNEDVRDKYTASICEGCNDDGYVRFRNGGDEDCSECGGEGMTYEKRMKEGD